MIRILILGLILLGALTFSMKNAQQEITLEYYFGLSTAPIPVYQVVVGTFILSGIVIILLLLPEWIKMRIKLRQQRKTLERVERELDRSRPTPPIQDVLETEE